MNIFSGVREVIPSTHRVSKTSAQVPPILYVKLPKYAHNIISNSWVLVVKLHIKIIYYILHLFYTYYLNTFKMP